MRKVWALGGAAALAIAFGCGGGKPAAVDAGAAPEVAIGYQASCSAFTPCGGDLEGMWTYADGCVEDPFPTLKTLCPSATYANLTVSARGAVSFTAGTASRDVTISGAGSLDVPASCAGSSCSSLAAALTAVGVASTCVDTGAKGDCKCDFTASRTIQETASYTLNGNTMTTNGRTYEYCVQGTTLMHHETGTDPKEPGTYVLDKN